MNRLIENPELLRHVRAELRPRRMLATFTACAVLSGALGAWAYGGAGDAAALHYLRLVVVLQALLLGVGGGIACLFAVRRDGDANEFDHERMTMLPAWELAVGKLLGAPLSAYFAALCLVPSALVGVFAGGFSPWALLATWLAVLVGSFATHALALLIAVRVRGAATHTAALWLVAAIGLSTVRVPALRMGPLNPIVAAADIGQPLPPDVFFGLRIPHLLLLVLIYAGVAAWLLLAVIRNLKRDPQAHELFSPLQALLLLLCAALVLLGVMDWPARGALPGQRALLALGAASAWLLGLALLHGPELARRRASRLVEPAGWFEVLWPAPAVAAATAIAGVAGVVTATFAASDKADYSPWVGLFSVAYLGLWLARDLIYLQWVRLTALPRPLQSGVLMLLGFYALGSLTLGLFSAPAPATAIVHPTALARLGAGTWTWAWLLPLLVQAGAAAGFAYLRLRQLATLGAPIT